MITASRISATILSAAVLFGSAAAQQAGDDEVSALVAGARAARMPLTQGKLRLEITRGVPGHPPMASKSILVEWKDDSLRFRELDSDNSVSRCSIRHDGELLFYTPSYGGGIDDSGKGYAYYLFDPRTLGVNATFSNTLPIEDLLFPQQGWKYERLRERERIDGRDCIVVRQTSTAHPGFRRNYWIENTEGFPVRKVFDYITNTSAESTYGDGVLPEQIRFIHYDRQGDEESWLELSVVDVSFEKIPEESFSLKGLGLRVGDSVIDQRLHRIIGYWNGEELEPTRQRLRSRTQREP